MEQADVFCPATIANVSCGFDVLGLCLEAVGDRMIIKKNQLNKLQITKVKGADLPYEVDKNVAGVAGLSLLKHLNSNQGFDIEIYKNIRLGSGIGSSAASCAGAVFGINELLGKPLSQTELVKYGMKGEALASGCEHADNVAPAILGGFTLVRSLDELEVISLPVPSELYASVIHPKIEIRTSDARSILRENITLKDAVKQWGNLASFVSALYSNDYELLSRSMVDIIIEPIRSLLIPSYDNIKKVSLSAGALGCGISGSGPSIFALSRGKEVAQRVLDEMSNTYEKTGIAYDLYLSRIAKSGTRLISPNKKLP